MAKPEIKRNERDWAGQLISWIKSAIDRKTTIFQDATNDTGVKMKSGRTKFPDILLFIDKTSGVIFNGWELKFPDTAVDDTIMLENALEKAHKLHSDSFVTWNGAEAIIWHINDEEYTLDGLSKLKVYPKVSTINSREDLADPVKFAQHEPLLKERTEEILHDLDSLYRNGALKPALDISKNIISAVREASTIIIPQFQEAIIQEKGSNRAFRDEFNKWKIYESSTLKILESSSRKKEYVIPEQVLAKFTFYNLIGKTIFYLTLCENLSGELEPITFDENESSKDLLNSYFDKAKKIDYQAIFRPYFTDSIEYSVLVDKAIYALLEVLTTFDFKVLPTEVIGHILENLVPDDEKQKFGQYFTNEVLAKLVAFPVIKTNKDVLFDPTCGTGTFLSSFYEILQALGTKEHEKLLRQIWGNDVSHFPAILSVINLYKQNVIATNNFPRVMRNDFFNLEVGEKVIFPDSHDHNKHIDVPIPIFDGIASNFPFIQQEDIPNEKLSAFFREQFQSGQQAFLKDKTFKINERSDYFTYCIYNADKFLKPDGCLSAITSNAWLGKEYGFQFKKFLLDNFHIRYVVKSNAEHWFKDSQVSTIYFVLDKMQSCKPTKFITLNRKLSELFVAESKSGQIQQIEDFYSDIDNCSDSHNELWEKDNFFADLYKRKDGSLSVCLASKECLLDSLENKTNWGQLFLSTNLFGSFESCLTQYYPNIVKVFRGERTGWNPMFVIKDKDVKSSRIDEKYLVPYVKSSSDLQQIEFDDNYKFRAFVCQDEEKDIDKGTKSWIDKFVNAPNKNGSQTISEACAGHRPYWYSLNPKRAHIITTINPYERFFFTFAKEPFVIDQRLIAMQVQDGYDIELIAALLNSVITFFILEIRGTSRNLGALDLNADYLKQICLLNPNLLSTEHSQKIKRAFDPLKHRKINSVFKEVNDKDRIKFDQTVFECFGLDKCMLQSVYALLISAVTDRVTLRKK
ncbi:type I restriction-modification system methyltransferase subunit [Prevotella dentalis DSM 3688]|uniref:site-specific DNA-methyltransferase (adenine-specific) n=1 Tax=Prevotella dentalis (strain ATCC 49559 / DSM 3688 / JCM 13448 / NCTC 12043 / ES 2772) TaxID=908937 RepID=F9D2M1_PREDD|nr:N-6 DNA methylase [Prevotella dentalis]AGB28552.1 type I restriction-modification system methyltransferase subunit [Prevotella dentalis DSM 3688]EGQ15536.1 N-6 DNA methylase superfamily protein [Prevotella dentalis DSM 3688]